MSLHKVVTSYVATHKFTDNLQKTKHSYCYPIDILWCKFSQVSDLYDLTLNLARTLQRAWESGKFVSSYNMTCTLCGGPLKRSSKPLECAHTPMCPLFMVDLVLNDDDEDVDAEGGSDAV